MPIDTTHLDADSDNILLARPALLATAQAANALQAAGASALVPHTPAGAGGQSASVAVHLNARTRSVLDFIPDTKHAGIRARTNTDDLTAYFQTAAVAVNGDVVAGAGNGGRVLVPAGRYRTNKIGSRDTVFEGEGIAASLIEAYSAGAGALLDCALNRDGVTANTDGGFGGFLSMKIDGRGLGYSGVRTYGGFSQLENLWVTGCVDGVNIGLPIAMNVSKVYSTANSGKGFHTYSGAGDIATSLTLTGCWGDTNGTYNFHIEQLGYSVFQGCASQNIPATGKGWFVEGSTNGAGVGSSLHFIGCASEGDLGDPFYFKNQRGIVISSPKIVSPPTNKHLLTFDNASGELNTFQSPGAGAGYYGVSIINVSDSDGSLVAVGGEFTLVDGHRRYITSIGAAINALRETTGPKMRLTNATVAQEITHEIANIDGYTGMVIKAGDGTVLHKLRRIGTPIFGTNGAIGVPATNLGLGDVSFYVDTAAAKLMFVCKDGGGNVKSGFVAIA